MKTFYISSPLLIKSYRSKQQKRLKRASLKQKIVAVG